jgi:nucleoside-diphosphate-sugar epimerase
MLTHHNTTPKAPSRAVVIGSGFVGGTIAAALKAAGVPVLALKRSELDLLAADATAKLTALLRPDDAVVFVSAVAPAKNAAQMMINLRMAEAAAAAFVAQPPAHLLYVSSDAIYADDANPVTESSAAAPTTTHGMMHAARELIFRSEYKGPFAALRPTLIYGAADPHSGYGPNRFRREALAGKPIQIFGEGEEKRDHVLVQDVAELARRILFQGSTGALNAVTGTSVAFAEIARLVAAQFTPKAAVASIPRPGPRPHLLHRFFDITACYKAFPDFRFTLPEEGIARVHAETMKAQKASKNG